MNDPVFDFIIVHEKRKVDAAAWNMILVGSYDFIQYAGKRFSGKKILIIIIEINRGRYIDRTVLNDQTVQFDVIVFDNGL